MKRLLLGIREISHCWNGAQIRQWMTSCTQELPVYLSELPLNVNPHLSEKLFPRGFQAWHHGPPFAFQGRENGVCFRLPGVRAHAG